MLSATELGEGLIAGFIALSSYYIGKTVYFYIKSDVKKCESPIEKQMHRALFDRGIKAIPQYPVSRCRIDLAVLDNGKKIAVECDGHAYHSTEEQISRDQRRDAFLESQGWTVVRFTGSEIYRSANECAKQVKRMIYER